MSGYISEIDYDGGAGSNFVEIVVPASIDTSGYTLVVYDKDGTIIETFSLGAPVNSIAGKNVYLLDDDNTPDWVDIHNNEALALVDGSGTVLQFIAFKDPVTAVEGPASGMSATQVGEHSGGDESLQSSDGGASYAPTETSDPGFITCYAPGTIIATPTGPRPVETLRPGDLVMTLDHGPQTIRWTCSSAHPLEDVETDAKPVQIKAGALGQNLPVKDLIVSPQHRIFVGGAGQLQAVFPSEAFAPAKSLTGLPGIRHMKGKKDITWINFACDQHEVATANGCRSETLLLGPMVLNGLSSARKKELTDIFGTTPTPDAALNGPAARDCLTVSAVRRQIAKYRKEKKYLVAKEVKKSDVGLAVER
ncbi:MAG: Hint domain-containing protein [Boseongicola sp.]|nr:Hint domain-containing protein [Boseongicola sp.]